MTNDELVQQLQEAQALIAKQAARLAELEARLVDLEQKLDEAQRRGKRQATPFSKGAPQAQPKPPGRKPGHPAAHRLKPERITRIVEANLPVHCPACGGTVIEETVRPQYQEDIPRPIETLITQFNVHIGHCADCAVRLQGRHAEQTSEALGSAAVQLGPNVLGLAAELKHDLGVSYGKVARFFRLTFGLEANASSFARADQRLAQDFAPPTPTCKPNCARVPSRMSMKRAGKSAGIPRGCGSLRMTASRCMPLIPIAIIRWSNAFSARISPECSSPIASSPMTH